MLLSLRSPDIRAPGYGATGNPDVPPLPATWSFPPWARDGVGGAGSGGGFRCGRGRWRRREQGGGGRPGRGGGGAAGARREAGGTAAAMKKQFNRMKQLANQTVGRWVAAVGPGSGGCGPGWAGVGAAAPLCFSPPPGSGRRPSAISAARRGWEAAGPAGLGTVGLPAPVLSGAFWGRKTSVSSERNWRDGEGRGQRPLLLENNNNKKKQREGSGPQFSSRQRGEGPWCPGGCLPRPTVCVRRCPLAPPPPSCPSVRALRDALMRSPWGITRNTASCAAGLGTHGCAGGGRGLCRVSGCEEGKQRSLGAGGVSAQGSGEAEEGGSSEGGFGPPELFAL